MTGPNQCGKAVSRREREPLPAGTMAICIPNEGEGEDRSEKISETISRTLGSY